MKRRDGVTALSPFFYVSRDFAIRNTRPMIQKLSVSFFLLASFLILVSCGRKSAEAEAPIAPFIELDPVVTTPGIKIRVEQNGVTSDTGGSVPLQVDLVPVALQASGYVTLRVEVANADGTVSDVTSSTEWLPTNPAVATLADEGGRKKLSGIKPGTSTMVAKYRSAAGVDYTTSFELRVMRVKGTIAQRTPSLRVGEHYQFQVIFIMENQSQVDVTSQLEFISQSPTLAVFEPGPVGNLRGVAAGDCQINYRQTWPGITSLGGGVNARINP